MSPLLLSRGSRVSDFHVTPAGPGQVNPARPPFDATVGALETRRFLDVETGKLDRHRNSHRERKNVRLLAAGCDLLVEHADDIAGEAAEM